MTPRFSAGWGPGLVFGLLFAWPALADTITLRAGGRVEGIITKLEAGKVYIEVAGAVREIELPAIAAVNFDTPHLTAGSTKVPLDHFLKNLDAQEMVRISQDMNQARQDARAELEKIKAQWAAKQYGDKNRWNAAKESFRTPLGRYRELVGDMYLHVLGQIDDYNKLTKEADQVHGLVPGDEWERAVKESVPKNWYDRIFFDGYNRGYKEGTEFERLSRVPQACETPR
jgi:hypothetical protein